jgi:hypothetical protein
MDINFSPKIGKKYEHVLDEMTELLALMVAKVAIQRPRSADRREDRLVYEFDNIRQHLNEMMSIALT